MASSAASGHVKPANEVEVRKAIAGLDADLMRETGVPREQALAISNALRRFLLGDADGARQELSRVFMNGTVEQILREFSATADAA